MHVSGKSRCFWSQPIGTLSVCHVTLPLRQAETSSTQFVNLRADENDDEGEVVEGEAVKDALFSCHCFNFRPTTITKAAAISVLFVEDTTKCHSFKQKAEMLQQFTKP